MHKILQNIRFLWLRAKVKSLGKIHPAGVSKAMFRFFMRPGKATFRSSHQTLADEAIGLEFVHKKRRIRGYMWGSGEKRVLIVHGWHSHALYFGTMIESLLAAGYQVMAFDFGAHGRSDGVYTNLPDFIDQLIHVLNRTGVPYAVIGHSLGAVASLFALTEYEGKMPERIISIAPPPRATTFFRQFSDALGGNDAIYQHFIEHTAKTVGRDIREFQLDRLGPMLPFDRMLHLHDLKDQAVSLEDVQQLLASWPEVAHHFTEGYGHNRILQAPEACDHILSFLTQATNQPDHAHQ
ncbi:MAG: alpha/beta fold hydrolase [Bacteroidota bacterium]